MSWSRYGIIKLVYLVYFKILENELFVIYLYVVCIYIYIFEYYIFKVLNIMLYESM